MFTIGAFAIILDKHKRVLLCHRRDYDLWNLPGGGVNKGESPWEGVIREVKEEVCLDVRIVRLQGVYYKPEKDDLVFSFICQPVGGKFAPTDEADEIKYYKLNDIPRNISAKQLERVRDALNNDNLVLKVQKGPASIELIKQGKL
jgi:8-oxo-dGTP diphosphatase